MKAKAAMAALVAAALVSGCASTRGGQNIACADFANYALEPKPHAIISDIQRYGVENRGADPAAALAFEKGQASPSGEDQGPVDAMIGQTVFGMDDAALEAEARRLREQYDRAGTQAVVKGGPSASLPAPGLDQNEIVVSSTLEPRNVLLLSGGGQWGAYGAGLFLGMICKQTVSARHDPENMPCLVKVPGQKRQITSEHGLLDFTALDEMDIGVITGVSTGSLQSLLLSVILDKTQTKKTRIAALQEMLDSYAPGKQSELVDYDGFLAVVFQGSVAGTTALRDHVRGVLEKRWDFRDGVLEPDGSYSGAAIPSRRLVDQIGQSPITTMVGIVEGYDGDFKSVNMRRMVREIQAEEEESGAPSSTRATDCVLATTLASSAMPVFHQQLRVVAGPEDDDSANGTTLFDGGVRRSVFISELGNAFNRRSLTLARLMGRNLYARMDKAGKLPRMYVLRNGPTTSVFNEKVNEVDGAINQALRAYELLVNELEVGSIAALRLANPYGAIQLSTADGSENDEYARPPGSGAAGEALRAGCRKNGEMFDPAFMVCLQNFGIRRGMALEYDKGGNRIVPFWPISPINPEPSIPVGVPANDN